MLGHVLGFLQTAASVAVPLMLAIITHEVAHGWAAEKLGDTTARDMGRITFNPLPHVDPVGSVILPLVLIISNSPFVFGWAKPVPVDYRRLEGGRRGVAIVSVAGPLANLTLAVISAILFHALRAMLGAGVLPGTGLSGAVLYPLLLIVRLSIHINIFLMILNLIPIPPLDGGHILMGLLPQNMAIALAKMERYGILLLLVLLMSGVLDYILVPVEAFFARILL